MQPIGQSSLGQSNSLTPGQSLGQSSNIGPIQSGLATVKRNSKTAPKPSDQNTTPQTKPEPEKTLVRNPGIGDDQPIINRPGVAGAVL